MDFETNASLASRKNLRKDACPRSWRFLKRNVGTRIFVKVSSLAGESFYLEESSCALFVTSIYTSVWDKGTENLSPYLSLFVLEESQLRQSASIVLYVPHFCCLKWKERSKRSWLAHLSVRGIV